jgi:hypothetical protein
VAAPARRPRLGLDGDIAITVLERQKTAMCEFIETYQTLIVGFVGFGGVIIAMLGNARLQRKQDERRERREARALRTALIEELKQQRAALRETAASLAAHAASIGNPSGLEKQGQQFRSDGGPSSLLSVMMVSFELRSTSWACWNATNLRPCSKPISRFLGSRDGCACWNKRRNRVPLKSQRTMFPCPRGTT